MFNEKDKARRHLKVLYKYLPDIILCFVFERVDK